MHKIELLVFNLNEPKKSAYSLFLYILLDLYLFIFFAETNFYTKTMLIQYEFNAN